MPSDVVIINHAHDVNEPCTSECRTPSGESVITILDEGAVDAILTTVRADGNLVLTLAERDALCATVKHLRWQVDLCEKAFELDTALRLSEVGDLNALQVVRKMVDLQSQLEQLRAENVSLKKHVDDLNHDLECAVKECNEHHGSCTNWKYAGRCSRRQVDRVEAER